MSFGFTFINLEEFESVETEVMEVLDDEGSVGSWHMAPLMEGHATELLDRFCTTTIVATHLKLNSGQTSTRSVAFELRVTSAL
ncbi:hypothetical protein RB195_010052 [Necator americanus]|uniref:Uncharacterized protein n=1 Tax=Necator americanus TaxID=51031 RepID=A0ABR1CYK7_NECAM